MPSSPIALIAASRIWCNVKYMITNQGCKNLKQISNLWIARLLRGYIWKWKSGKSGRLKGRYSSSWGEPHLRAAGRHLPYGITQCYLPSDTSEGAPPNPSHAGWYSIYLPRRDGSWVDLADLIVPRPGVELATFRSWVWRPTTAPPRQPWLWRKVNWLHYLESHWHQ